MKPAAQMKARDYYLSGEKTQRQIAEELNISEKTLYLWIKQNSWDQIKKAAYEAPALIVNNMFSQLVELQNNIAARENGQRYPTGQEAEITRKLITCILKLKDYPSKGSFIQMMTGFIEYTSAIDPEFTDEAKNYAEDFFHQETKSGYKPYEASSNGIEGEKEPVIEQVIETPVPVQPIPEEPVILKGEAAWKQPEKEEIFRKNVQEPVVNTATVPVNPLPVSPVKGVIPSKSVERTYVSPTQDEYIRLFPEYLHPTRGRSEENYTPPSTNKYRF